MPPASTARATQGLPGSGQARQPTPPSPACRGDKHLPNLRSRHGGGLAAGRKLEWGDRASRQRPGAPRRQPARPAPPAPPPPACRGTAAAEARGAPRERPDPVTSTMDPPRSGPDPAGARREDAGSRGRGETPGGGKGEGRVGGGGGVDAVRRLGPPLPLAAAAAGGDDGGRRGRRGLVCVAAPGGSPPSRPRSGRRGASQVFQNRLGRNYEEFNDLHEITEITGKIAGAGWMEIGPSGWNEK